jgi:integrase
VAVPKIPVDKVRYPGLVEYQYADGTKGYGRRVWDPIARKQTLRKFSGDPDLERAIKLWHGERTPEGERVARKRRNLCLPDIADDYFAGIEKRLDRPAVAVAVRRQGKRKRGVGSPNTLRTYKTDYNKYVEPYFGTSCFVHDIDSTEIESWLDWLREQPGKVRGTTLAEYSCNAKLTVLRNLLNLALRRGAIDSDPMLGVDPVQLPLQDSCEEYDLKPLRTAGLLRLVDAIEDPEERNVVTLLAFTGMRRAELNAILWHEADLLGGSIGLTRSLDKLRKGQPPKRISLKNKWLREVPILDLALEALASQRDLEEAKGFGGDNDYLITQSGARGVPGRPIDHDAITDIVRRAGETAGLGQVTPKTLRKTAGTILANTDIPDHLCAYYMGHSVEVFFQNYVQPYLDAEERELSREKLRLVGWGVRGEES